MNSPVISLPNGDFIAAKYLKDWYQTGHMGPAKGIELNEYMVMKDTVYQIHKVIVHRFTMGDVEDPDLYAAEPLFKWQASEMGKFVMEKSLETPVWHRMTDPANYGYQYAIEAWLKGPDYSFWVLKWGNDIDNKDVYRV